MTKLSYYLSNSHHVKDFLLIVLIVLLGITCSSWAQDDVQTGRLAKMQLYKNKLDDQLSNIQTLKQNNMALRDAYTILTPYVDNLNFNKDQLETIMNKAMSDLISLQSQEHELMLKQQLIGSSIAILTQRQDSADLLADPSQATFVPGSKCICFDANSGKSCKPQDLPTDLFSIVESTLPDGTVVKNLSSVQNYVPATCREYLTNFYTGKTGNGLYLIKPSSDFPSFPVYCDMNKGGWIYLNGILTYETPFKQPITPITSTLVESVEFKSLIKLANQVKSMVGDECTISYEPDDYHEKMMTKLCTIDGFATPGKYISFFQYFIR